MLLQSVCALLFLSEQWRVLVADRRCGVSMLGSLSEPVPPVAAEKRKLAASAAPPEKQARRCGVEEPLDMRRTRPTVIRRGASAQPTEARLRPPVVEPPTDPIVEAHFRRSLGSQYAVLFSGTAEAEPLTVDDHFARALGETWLRLQHS